MAADDAVYAHQFDDVYAEIADWAAAHWTGSESSWRHMPGRPINERAWLLDGLLITTDGVLLHRDRGGPCGWLR